ncbi:winged helix-turn-helix domain-containing protein [Paraburkholderia flava]|uniref:winged helix-turn-helix domain-containing protein n=1 Tax=Paraburkholderia flava TaxID=2547393 RepID=UPI00105C9F8A|nr:winged helix-turn-helix domain-containing protein [Paraburkholderia flava]
MSLPRPTGPVIAFGRYRLLQAPVRLVADDVPVDIGTRALEVLATLIEAQGRPVPHAALAERAWPGSAVDANTVQSQVSALRRALGADRDLIVTVPGFGYRFAAPAHTLDHDTPGTEPIAAAHPVPANGQPQPMPTPRMPARMTPFIGRHAELSELLGLVTTTRVVTLTGAPGVGKRRLAHEVARRLAAHVPDGICAVSFSSQLQPDSLVDTLALALHVPAEPGATTLERLTTAIGTRRLLLIVDCCEQLCSAAAFLLGTLVDVSPNLRVIVTAANPLGIEHEGVVPLAPLRTPARMLIDAAEARQFDALRLLFARFAVLFDAPGHTLSRRNRAEAELVAAFDTACIAPNTLAAAALIACRLDGVPLALELAAAAIVRQTSVDRPLDAAIRVFAREIDAPSMRYRDVTPVAAVLGLQMNTLEDAARTMFERLGIFPGEFTRGAAVQLLAECAAVPRPNETHDINEKDTDYNAQLDLLLDAGLVERIEGGGDATLRLHGEVRLFARYLLWHHGEFERTAAAHALSLAPRLAMNGQRAGRTAKDTTDRTLLDDLRAALDWAMQSDRIDVAISLLDGSQRLWRSLALAHEYLRAIRASLARVDASVPRRMRDEMRLQITLARALPFAHAPLDEIIAAWQEAYDLANACADSTYRQHALAGLIACFAGVRDLDRAAAATTNTTTASGGHVEQAS